MNTIKYLTLFLSSIFLLLSKSVIGCSDYPTNEYTRLGSFYLIPRGMEAYKPFIYTFDNYYSTDSDPLNTEKELILNEWQREIGNKINRKDMEIILYQTKPNMFVLSYLYKRLNFTFEGNSFVEFLTLPKNKAYLEYILLLKEMEYVEFYLDDTWSDEEGWMRNWNTGIQNKMFEMFCNYYINKCKKQMTGKYSDFLKQRYNFQLAKMLFKIGKTDECESNIKTYFSSNPSGILNNAMFHYMGVCATMKNDTARANLYFARSFRNGNERKFRNMQLYYKSDKCINKSLSFTSNKSEKALLIAMAALRYPGHALNQLQRIEEFDRNIPEFLFLIYREVNKFDDWIISPVYTHSAPTISAANYWEKSFDKILNANLKKDKMYLAEFIKWLSITKDKFNGESKLYLELAYVHLCLLNENYTDAINCFKTINIKETSTYIGLYKSERIFLNIMRPDFNNDENLNFIAKSMKTFEFSALHDELQCKMLSTLNQVLSYKMNKIGRKAYAGLMLLKSDVYAGMYVDPDSYNYYSSYYSYDKSLDYNKISWFDENAGIADLDTLIALSLNKNKKYFQQFYTDSILGETDLYRDLKGNMAFRNGNITLANASFKLMNQKYWDNEYFKYDLSSNPFIPKYWPSCVNTNYNFNKYKFTTQLLNLIAQTKLKDKTKAAEAWLKLGHAFYNTSWWGNSWMMCEYYRTSSLSYSFEYLSSNRYKNKKAYYNCSKAEKCYLNVIKTSKDKELIAAAVFMLHACELNNAVLSYKSNDYSKRPKNLFYKSNWLYQFAQKYQGTKVYEEYLSNCSYLTDYMKNGFIKF